MVTRGAWHRKDAGVNISRASIDLMGTYTFLFSFSGTGNAQLGHLSLQGMFFNVTDGIAV